MNTQYHYHHLCGTDCFKSLKSNGKTKSTFKQKFCIISYPVNPFKFLHIKLPAQTPDDTNHTWLGHENLFLQRPLPHFMKEKSNSPTLSCQNSSNMFLRNKNASWEETLIKLKNALNSCRLSVTIQLLKLQKVSLCFTKT